jgi:hypothetical protein
MLFLEYQMLVALCHEHGVPAPPPPMGFNIPGGVTITRDPVMAPAKPRNAGRVLRCVETDTSRRRKLLYNKYIGN